MSDHQKHEQSVTEPDRRKRVSRRAYGPPAPAKDARLDGRPPDLRSQGEVGKAAPDAVVDAARPDIPPPTPSLPEAVPLTRTASAPAALGKPAASTLAAGGMSPVADRKRPNIWSPSTPVSATGKPQAAVANTGRSAAPSEPIGGWVEASAKAAKTPVPSDGTNKAVRGGPSDNGAQETEGSEKKPIAEGVDDSPSSGGSTEPDEVTKRRSKVVPKTGGEENED